MKSIVSKSARFYIVCFICVALVLAIAWFVNSDFGFVTDVGAHRREQFVVAAQISHLLTIYRQQHDGSLPENLEKLDLPSKLLNENQKQLIPYVSSFRLVSNVGQRGNDSGQIIAQANIYCPPYSWHDKFSRIDCNETILIFSDGRIIKTIR